MTRVYERSAILDFTELTDDQQRQAVELEGLELAEETSYVLLEGEPLPLNMFMRTDPPYNAKSKLWDGIYAVTAFSGYFIKLSNSGDCAVVAARYY